MSGHQHALGAGRQGFQPAEHAPLAAVAEHIHGEHMLPDPRRGQDDLLCPPRDLLLEGSSPFRRGRRTVIALDRREPAQHSRDTHDRHYVLPDHRVQAEALEVIADCSAYRASPWPSADGGCGASFLMCLACPNAPVHPGHHPRLAHLHEALGSLRSVLPPAAWAADWRDAHDRLEDLRQRLGDGLWAQGLSQVTDADRDLISHLLTGALDT